MAKKRRSGANKIPVRYKDDVVSIEYVARAPLELRRELVRVQTAIQEVTRVLSTLKRIRHPVIKTARFQLKHAVRELPEDASNEEVSAELARLSYLMEDTLGVINKLKHCRIAHLELARFKLTYGQTPKKREPPERYGKKANRKASTDG